MSKSIAANVYSRYIVISSMVYAICVSCAARVPFPKRALYFIVVRLCIFASYSTLLIFLYVVVVDVADISTTPHLALWFWLPFWLRSYCC